MKTKNVLLLAAGVGVLYLMYNEGYLDNVGKKIPGFKPKANKPVVVHPEETENLRQNAIKQFKSKYSEQYDLEKAVYEALFPYLTLNALNELIAANLEGKDVFKATNNAAIDELNKNGANLPEAIYN